VVSSLKKQTDAKSRIMQNDLAVEIHTVEQIKALIKRKSYKYFHVHIFPSPCTVNDKGDNING